VQELTQWILNNFIPALDAFISGLTGQGGLDDSLSDSQKTAMEWGQNLRRFIDTVINLKDEIIVLGAVIAAAFTISKIAAGVTATIALIKTLITAYNALKASAIVAGVASAFALNPLLGVGAAALAAGVLSAANAIANKYNTDVSGLGGGSVGGTNLGSRPLGGTARATMTPEEFADRVAFERAYAESTKGGSTGSKTAQTLIEQVTQENFIRNLAPGAFDPGGIRQKDEAGITINVNAPSIIDRENFSRAVVDALNESNARTGGGGGQLIL
jgi:hypothetical protein